MCYVTHVSVRLTLMSNMIRREEEQCVRLHMQHIQYDIYNAGSSNEQCNKDLFG